MISRADLNDKWASCAGPGGWNGNHPHHSLVLDSYQSQIA